MHISFSNPAGPSNGRDSDGALHSRLSYNKPTHAYSASIATAATGVMRGNSDGNGGMTYEDISAALGSIGGTETTLFDDVDPTGDEIWIEIDDADVISGFGLYITTAGVYTGTAACEVKYKNTSGEWVTAACALSEQLDAIGIVYVTFDSVNGGSVALQDALIDPSVNPTSRRFMLRFSGITGVTTAPVIDMVFKMSGSGEHILTDSDSYAVDTVAEIPALYDTLNILSHVGDRTMFCFDKPFALLKTTIEKERLTPDAKMVYSKADGTFGDLTMLAMNSDSAARAGQYATIDPGASPVEYIDILTPPADWAEQTITIGGEEKTGYWIGIEYTSESTAPVLAMLIALQAAEFKGTEGVECNETIVDANVSLYVRSASTADSTFAIINLTKSTYALLTLPADTYQASVETALDISIGDKVAIQQLTGSEVSVPSDGFFTINN